MIYIIDTETTGRGDPPEIIEIASIWMEEGSWAPSPCWWARYKSRNGSSYGALAIHHILDEELVDRKFYYPESPHRLEPEDYIVGHHIDYDWTAMGMPAVKRICTLAMSRAVWPDLDSHSLGALTYFLQEDKAKARKLVKQAHGAAVDVKLCYNVLFALLSKRTGILSAEDLWKWSEECRVPKTWTFGKFQGEPIKKADRGYLMWCLRQPDMDPYVKIAVREALK